MSADRPPACRICGTTPALLGTKRSEFTAREYALAQCPECHYSFVVDPRVDFDGLYDAAYYRGEGPARHTDYEGALRDERTTQLYEWRAIVTVLEALGGLGPATRWLDYGCGLGGLVRYARTKGLDVVGFDRGYAAEQLRVAGVPSVTRGELGLLRGQFGVVTAIEVIEHEIDPVAMLREVSALLAPSGILFLTTANAAPFRKKMLGWQYVQPDVHVSFFEPGTLARALGLAGLEAEYPGYARGYTDLIRAKVLRTLGVRRRNVLERCLPWAVVSRFADHRYGVSAHPIGRKV